MTENCTFQQDAWGHLTLQRMTKIHPRPNSQEFAEDNLNVVEMVQFFFDSAKNIVEKSRKILVTSLFSFSQNVFKWLPSQGH